MENKKVAVIGGDGSLPSCSIDFSHIDMSCADSVPFFQCEPIIITNPYCFEPPTFAERAKSFTIFGGAYNCRKPKYKTKKRR